MSLGKRIQALRKKKGISQEQLAEKLNISRQAVSKWETDESLPDTDKIILLSRIFDVTTDYLLCGVHDDKDILETGYSSHCKTPDFINKLIQKKGYIAGYIISLYGVLGFLLMRFAHFIFKKMLMPPGFDVVLSELPIPMKFPLYLTNLVSILALFIIAAGLLLAFYLRKKTKDKN